MTNTNIYITTKYKSLMRSHVKWSSVHPIKIPNNKMTTQTFYVPYPCVNETYIHSKTNKCTLVKMFNCISLRISPNASITFYDHPQGALLTRIQIQIIYQRLDRRCVIILPQNCYWLSLANTFIINIIKPLKLSLKAR